MVEEYGIGSFNEETGEIDGWCAIPKSTFIRIEKMCDIHKRNGIADKKAYKNSKHSAYLLVDTGEGSELKKIYKIPESVYDKLLKKFNR